MDLLSLFNTKQYQSVIDYSSSPQFVLSSNPNDGHVIAASHYYLGNYLQAVEICSQVYNFLNGDAVDSEKEMGKYQQSLINNPIDVACIGIGENGHIAFNDPDEADFNDNLLVKLVNLDEACRRQQFTEGWFPSFKAVPKQAFTLTIPAILNSKVISCVVPDQRKSKAVFDALTGQIKTSCPASILRTHPQTSLFLDRDSASKLDI